MPVDNSPTQKITQRRNWTPCTLCKHSRKGCKFVISFCKANHVCNDLSNICVEAILSHCVMSGISTRDRRSRKIRTLKDLERVRRAFNARPDRQFEWPAGLIFNSCESCGVGSERCIPDISCEVCDHKRLPCSLNSDGFVQSLIRALLFGEFLGTHSKGASETEVSRSIPQYSAVETPGHAYFNASPATSTYAFALGSPSKETTGLHVPYMYSTGWNAMNTTATTLTPPHDYIHTPSYNYGGATVGPGHVAQSAFTLTNLETNNVPNRGFPFDFDLFTHPHQADTHGPPGGACEADDTFRQFFHDGHNQH